jgi:hypothetical protein
LRGSRLGKLGRESSVPNSQDASRGLLISGPDALARRYSCEATGSQSAQLGGILVRGRHAIRQWCTLDTLGDTSKMTLPSAKFPARYSQSETCVQVESENSLSNPVLCDGRILGIMRAKDAAGIMVRPSLGQQSMQVRQPCSQENQRRGL